MVETDETLLSAASHDDAPQLAVDDNILTDNGLPLTSGEANVSADHSTKEIIVIPEAQNEGKSAAASEIEDATSSSLPDGQQVSDEGTGEDECLQDDENLKEEVPLSSEDVSKEVDTSCAEEDAAIIKNNDRQEEKTDSEGVNDTFVSVELSSSPTKTSSNEDIEKEEKDDQQPLIDAAASVPNYTAAVCLNPSSEVVPNDPSNNESEGAKSSFNIAQKPTTTTATARRRRILHHPILSRLTKLPWDRLSNAGNACDVLFNCKYSMRQVEDEVREECRRGVSGEGVYIEDDRVGREDGYVNVSLNSCNDYHYQEEGCEAEEFEQILGCCSMLDNDEDSDEDDGDEEEVGECELLDKNAAAQKGPPSAQPMGLVEGRHVTVEIKQEGGEEEREYSGDIRVNSNGNEVEQQQQSEKSWQQSNPSLDMMLYRQFLND